MTYLLRFFDPQLGVRVGCSFNGDVFDVTTRYATVTAWLFASQGDPVGAVQHLRELSHLQGPVTTLDALNNPPASHISHLLAPVDEQEVWAAGVTYQRSRVAREEESDHDPDIYSRVYNAERPEIFFKAFGDRVAGPNNPIGVRVDAKWTVPEPELAVVFNPALEVVGFTIGNDVTSRDIEAANPLYLPQAKIYKDSCALGPVIWLEPMETWPQVTIALQITRRERIVFQGETHTTQIHRTLEDLVSFLKRSNNYPHGFVLLSGTGIVPPDEVRLQSGDSVSITIDGIGKLTNTVQTV